MYYLALLTGFFGSLHCIGMCGPLAMAIPLPRQKRLAGLLLYNAGRTIAYASLGIIFGALGLAIKLSGYQQTLSVVMGIFFLLAVLLPYISKKVERKIYGFQVVKKLKANIVEQFKRKTYLSALTVGMLNGFLPCGLVYFAIAGSAATGHFLNGGIYMVLFSLGTLPAMLSVGFIHKFVQSRIKFNFTAALGLVLAFILIYRGVAMEIPEISSALNQVGLGKITTCGN